MVRRKLLTVCYLLVFGSVLRSGGPEVPGRYHDLSKTGLLRVWGSPEQDVALGHTFAFTPDGKFALSASGGGIEIEEKIDDGILALWDVERGSIVREIAVPKATVTALAISADGKQALTGTATPVKKGDILPGLLLWDLNSGKVAKELPAPTAPVVSVALSRDGKRALTGTLKGTLQYWDLTSGKEVRPLEGHKDEPAVAVAFTPDGRFALSADKATLKFWDLETGKALHTMNGAKGSIYSIALSADGKRAISGGYEEVPQVWDLTTGKRVLALKKAHEGHDGSCVALADDGKKALVVRQWNDAAKNTLHSTISLWDLDSGKELWTTSTEFKGLTPPLFLPGGTVALAGGGANSFAVFELADGSIRRLYGGHKGPINALAVDAAGNVYSAGQDRCLKRWNAKGKEMFSYRGHHDGVSCVAVTTDGKLALTGSGDHTVKLWDVATGKELHKFTGHTGAVTSITLSADGKRFLTGSSDRTLKLWDVDAKKELKSFTGHAEGINGVALSPDGKWAASASDDNTIRLWPLEPGKDDEPRTLEDHKRQVTGVAFSADGKKLLSASQDQTIKLWDVAEGKVLNTLEGHKNWVTSASFLGADRAASVSDDLTVRFWDLTTGKEVERIDLGKSMDCPRSLALVPGNDGRLLVGTAGWVILEFAAKQPK